MTQSEAIKRGLRPCIVNGNVKAFFHEWEHFSKPISESLLKGGAPAGVISITMGIVENAYTGYVFRCDVQNIQFVDDFESENSKEKK